MFTFDKNQRRILRGLLVVGAEREAGDLIVSLRKTLASARIGRDNLAVIHQLHTQLTNFEKHLLVDYDNLPSELRMFHVARLFHQGLITNDELSEFDPEMLLAFNEIVAMLEQEDFDE